MHRAPHACMHAWVWRFGMYCLRLLLFCTCPPLCAGALSPMHAWVWRDVRFGFTFFCLDGTHTLGYDVAKAKRCAIPACRLSHRHRTRTSQRGRAAVTDPHRVRMQVQMQQYMDSRHMHTVNGGHTRPSRSLTKQKRRPGMCASTGPGGGVGVNVECAVSSTAISQLDLDNFG